MVPFGADYTGQPVVAQNAEYKMDPDIFIYCSNTGCGLAGTGLCRVHDGPGKESNCRRCKCKFPSKPNGKTFGGLHREALLAGKLGTKKIPMGGGFKGNKGGGKGGGAGGGNSRLDNMERQLGSIAQTLGMLANQDEASWPAFENRANKNGGTPQRKGWGKGDGKGTRGEPAAEAPADFGAGPGGPAKKAVVVPPSQVASPEQVVSDRVALQFPTLPAEYAAQVADIIIKNGASVAPIAPAKPLKATAQAQQLHEAYQASLKQVSFIRETLDKNNTKLATLREEMSQLVAETVSLQTDLAKAKTVEHECAVASMEFEKSQNSISASAAQQEAASKRASDDVFLVKEVLDRLSGNPLWTQTIEGFKVVLAAHSPVPSGSPPVAGQFAAPNNNPIILGVSPPAPGAAASSVSGQGPLAPAQGITGALPGTSVVEITDVVSTETDESMAAKAKVPTSESGDEQRCKLAKTNGQACLDAIDNARAAEAALGGFAPTATSNSFGALQDEAAEEEEPFEAGDADPNVARAAAAAAFALKAGNGDGGAASG